MFVKVDDIDVEVLSRRKWVPQKKTYTFYAVAWGKRRMHREILNLKNGQFCDHIDGDGLNNQRKNLRVCTHAENCRNRRKRRDGETSKFKGVHVEKASKVFVSSLRLNGRLINLGRFLSETDAALAYNNAAVKYFGEYAKVNNV